MIATNICEWLSVVVEETRHEIAELGSGGHILAERGKCFNGFRNSSLSQSTRKRGLFHSPVCPALFQTSWIT